MACFLQKNMKFQKTGMRVVVMIKDKYNPGKFKYIEKPIMHLISKDITNSSTVMAYIIPGYDNDYNYMYILSRTLRNSNIFSGEHFTMGLRDKTRFDIHYTSYDYHANSKPSHLFYNVVVNETTSPRNIADLVCNTRMHPNDDTRQRCSIFYHLIKHVHEHENDSCVKPPQPPSLPMSTYGGSRKRKTQKGGNANANANAYRKLKSIDEVDEPFKTVFEHLEEKIGVFQNVQSVEMLIIENNKGLITYCLENEQVKSMRVSASGVGEPRVEEHVSNFTTYYALPFDFATYEFITVEELVANVPGHSVASMNSSKHVRIPLKDVVLCGDQLDYESIMNMVTKTGTKTKTCVNAAPRIIPAITATSPMVSVTSGGGNKKKLTTKKQSKKQTKN